MLQHLLVRSSCCGKAPRPPWDLSQQIGDTVPEKFGRGATMTVPDQGIYCQDKRERQLDAKRTLADALAQEKAKAEADAKKAHAAADATKTAVK